jgi:16S rRNA C967 or C1407 C5-methylase (RsmB/RsmF family)
MLVVVNKSIYLSVKESSNRGNTLVAYLTPSCLALASKPCADRTTLQSELPVNSSYPVPVPWLDERMAFYALPGDFSLAQSPCFRSGRVYGQDVSSGAAVAALLSDQYDTDTSTGTGTPPGDADAAVSTTTNATQEVVLTASKEESPFRVLDLCCSPGLKLCAIADWLLMTQHGDGDSGSMNTPSAVVGVDISESRTALCKRIVTKYHVDPDTCKGGVDSSGSPKQDTTEGSNVRIRLYCNDGTTFGLESNNQALNLVFDSAAAAEEYRVLGKRKRMNKSARARERKRLKQLIGIDEVPVVVAPEESSLPPPASPGITVELFDRVLVDAECSTDGSLKHVQQRLMKKEKQRQEDDDPSNPQLIPQLTDDQQLADLVRLQQRLAESGFRLLKQGGYMVYSTCSLSGDQNEGVVSWLLKQHTEARVVPVRFASDLPETSSLIKQGTLPGTIRFVPNTKSYEDSPATSGDGSLVSPSFPNGLFGGGFFLAKIQKAQRMTPK